VIEGENLTVDSVGVKKLYDVVVPAQANKILKEMGGGKVGEVGIDREVHMTKSAELKQEGLCCHRITDEVVARPIKLIMGAKAIDRLLRQSNKGSTSPLPCANVLCRVCQSSA
jgi:hypothetical protein